MKGTEYCGYCVTEGEWSSVTVWRVEKYARSILEFRFGLERAARKLLAAWISCSCLDGGLELVMLWWVFMVTVKKAGMGENECRGEETQMEGTTPVMEGKGEGRSEENAICSGMPPYMTVPNLLIVCLITQPA